MAVLALAITMNFSYARPLVVIIFHLRVKSTSEASLQHLLTLLCARFKIARLTFRQLRTKVSWRKRLGVIFTFLLLPRAIIY